MRLSPMLLQTVGNLSGLKVQRVEELSMYHQTQVRKMDREAAAIVIGNEIHSLAKEYGNREKIDDAVARECVGIIGDRFGFLSPKELRVAYRMWASGQIEVSKSGEMYGGQINARQVGAVLSAYAEWRKFEMARYLSALAEQKEQEEREAKNAEAAANSERVLLEELKAAIDHMEDWRDVKDYWFKALWTRGWLSISEDELLKICEDVKVAAIQERSKREEQSQDAGRIFEKVAQQKNIEESLRWKLAVWRHYIEPKRKQP